MLVEVNGVLIYPRHDPTTPKARARLAELAIRAREEMCRCPVLIDPPRARMRNTLEQFKLPRQLPRPDRRAESGQRSPEMQPDHGPLPNLAW
jgi:hypothetical protein